MRWGTLLLPGIAIAATVGGLSGSTAGPVAARAPRELLRDLAQITDREWSAIERGEPVAKSLDTAAREIAIVGAVRIAGSSESLVARVRDLQTLKRSAIVIDVGRFSEPPEATDLVNVPFEVYNLDLRDCRPGDC